MLFNAFAACLTAAGWSELTVPGKEVGSLAKQIYRKALLERMSSPDQLDKMIVITPPAFWLALLGGAAIVAVALVWSILGRLPINLEASGIFVSDQMAFTLASDTGGIVSTLEVEIGDHVEEGDVLLTLADEAVQRELAALLDRRAKVEAVTLTSANDEVTADNRDLINLKTQLGAAGSESDQNRAMLAVYQSELAALRPQVSAAQAEMEAARENYYAYIRSNTDSQIEIEFSEAQSKYNQQVSLLAQAEANLNGAWTNYYNTVDSLKMSLSQGLSNAITDAEQQLRSAESTRSAYSGNYNLVNGGLTDLRAQKSSLERSLNQQKAVMNNIKSVIVKQQELAKLMEELEALQGAGGGGTEGDAPETTATEGGGEAGGETAEGGNSEAGNQSDLQEKINKLQEKINKLITEIDRLLSQIGIDSVEQLPTASDTVSANIEGIQAKIAEVDSYITSQQKELNNLRSQIDSVQNTIDSLNAAIAKYKRGQTLLGGISSTTPPEGFHVLVESGVLESNSYSSLQNVYSQCQTARNAYEEAKIEHDRALAEYNTLKAAYTAYADGRAETDAEKEKLGTLYNQLSSDYNALYSQQTNLEANITSIEGQLRASNIGSEVQRDGYAEQFEAARSAVLDGLDAEIEKYQYNLEKTNIRATVSGNVTDIKVGVGAAVGQGAEIVTIRQLSEEDHIICYIPISSGKKVGPGMEVIVSPTTVNRQEYGHMQAEVVAVDDYVTPASSIRATLGDEMLAQAFTQNGPVVAVTCRLRTDETTASGYWWSSKKGADLIVPEGTMVTVDIVTEEKAPITMLIPYLKEKLSMAVEPGSGGKEGQ